MARRNQSGFAMLLVLLMAAVVAILLYSEMPRVAFEAQRQKEQLLIERGEQYKRAIYLFWRINQRYPASMDDLTKSQNRHYLRHKYVDPMTGKDEWRLVHIQNGMLVDSVNSTGQGKGKDQQQAAPMGYIGQQAYIGSLSQPGGALAAAQRRRASEGGAGAPGSGPELLPDSQPPDTSGGAPGAPGGAGGAPLPNPGAPAGAGTAGLPPGVPGAPGSLPGGPTPPTQPGQLPQLPPGTYVPGTGMQPGPNQQPPQPGAAPQPGQTPQVPNAAIAAIDALLRSPRPGGLQGLQNAQAGGLAGGSGIAGVASQADADSIMVYNDHSNYKEWEFIFDFSKWKPPQDPRGSGAGGTPVKDMGSQPGTQPGSQPATTPQLPGR